MSTTSASTPPGIETQLVQGLRCRPRRINLDAALLQVLRRKHLNEGFVLNYQDACGRGFGVDNIPKLFPRGLPG